MLDWILARREIDMSLLKSKRGSSGVDKLIKLIMYGALLIAAGFAVRYIVSRATG